MNVTAEADLLAARHTVLRRRLLLHQAHRGAAACPAVHFGS